MDHGLNGSRFFDNESGDEISLKDIAVRWQKEGSPEK